MYVVVVSAVRLGNMVSLVLVNPISFFQSMHQISFFYY